MVVEHDEIILVRRRGKAVRLWCNQCEAQVSMLRVEDASALVGVTARTIYRWIEAGKLHFAESDKGLVLICAQSLASLVNPDRAAERKKILTP
jgi:excisionase family DNA binding protein